MRTWLAALIAIVALGSARLARTAASSLRERDATEAPFAPSPGAAPIVFVGYREAAADLLWVRLLGYWGSREADAAGIADLVDAIVALDPQYHRIYVTGAHAMQLADHGVTQETFMRSLRVLERGMKEFPDDYRIPLLAGEIYTGDLRTDDPAQRRAWDEKGTSLIEAAIRKPGAPADLGTYVAHMQSKLGHQQRAIANLREMILLTRDVEARKQLIAKLAQLENADAAEVASEMYEEKRHFEEQWQHDRPALRESMYLLVGPRPRPGFDMTDLATGGREPIDVTSAGDPRSP